MKRALFPFAIPGLTIYVRRVHRRAPGCQIFLHADCQPVIILTCHIDQLSPVRRRGKKRCIKLSASTMTTWLVEPCSGAARHSGCYVKRCGLKRQGASRTLRTESESRTNLKSGPKRLFAIVRDRWARCGSKVSHPKTADECNRCPPLAPSTGRKRRANCPAALPAKGLLSGSSHAAQARKEFRACTSEF